MTPCEPTRTGSTGSTSIPVPDGDTGTNMALTLESVVAGLGEGPTRPLDMA